MINIRVALEKATQMLKNSQTEARLEAEILLCYFLNKNRSYLYAYSDALLSNQQLEDYFQLVEQRVQGIPIAYIIQSREFWSLTLKVTPDTLIPRHETERLVELALELVPNGPNVSVLDLGTGSGAIALAIAKERPLWHIDACDDSQHALNVAKENAHNNGISNIHFYHSNWFNNLPVKQYHLIVSNPPYINEHDPHLAQGDVQFEPRNALISGDGGLADLRHIIQQGYSYLSPNGLLLLEHGYDQKFQVSAILNEFGYQEIKCWKDILGHDRVSGGRHPT